jgi:hypothetical protein
MGSAMIPSSTGSPFENVVQPGTVTESAFRDSDRHQSGITMTQRFVILEHHHEGVHYDLMLEVEGTLRTWRLAQPIEADHQQVAMPSFDHRLAYLNYEGPIRGGRGHVRRWDVGTYAGAWQPGNQQRFQLMGQRCRGTLQLEQVDDQTWTVTLSLT